MKSALLFPGLDALFMSSRLRAWLSFPATVSALDEASRYLSERTGETENLREFLENHSRPHLKDFDRTLVLLTALQVGIAKALLEKHDVDMFVGCSHGDVARSVVSGVLDFGDAVDVLWTFAELRKTCPAGSTANVRTVDGSPLRDEHFAWLDRADLSVSVWSESHATVASDNETLARAAAECRSIGLKLKPVLPYPVHSRVMQPSTDELRRRAVRWKLNAPPEKWSLFSSVHLEFLRTREQIFEEALAGSIKPVRWVEALTHLYKNEGVRRFLNVGPSNTLTGWILNSERFSELQVWDSADVLGVGADATSSNLSSYSG